MNGPPAWAATTGFPMVEQRSECPHGDPTCPCPDRYGDCFDPCHYDPDDGPDPWRCPTTGVVGCRECRR